MYMNTCAYSSSWVMPIKINTYAHKLTYAHARAHTHSQLMIYAYTCVFTCVMPTRTSLLAELVLSKSGPPDLRNPLAPLTNPLDRISRTSSRLGSLSFPFMLGGRGF